MTTVIEECVDRLLQHPFFVANDDFRRFECQQCFQAVVAVDDATIEVIQVGGGETSAFKRNERAQIRRNNRQHFEGHPLGTRFALDEPFDDFHLLNQLFAGHFAAGGRQCVFELAEASGQIDFLKQFTNPFGPDAGVEAVNTVVVERLAIFEFREKLFLFKRSFAGINHDVVIVVDDVFEVAHGHIQKEAHAAGRGFKEPDMGNRNSQLNVSHAFATDA